QGILLAMILSLLRHVRHSYRPHTAVLVQDESGQWRSTSAVAGGQSGPRPMVFPIGVDLFFAHAPPFLDHVPLRVEGAPTPVSWLVVAAGAITNIDYSAAAVLRDFCSDLARDGVGLLLVHANESLQADLERHHLIDVIGADHIFDTLREALAAL